MRLPYTWDNGRATNHGRRSAAARSWRCSRPALLKGAKMRILAFEKYGRAGMPDGPGRS